MLIIIKYKTKGIVFGKCLVYLLSIKQRYKDMNSLVVVILIIYKTTYEENNRI